MNLDLWTFKMDISFKKSVFWSRKHKFSTFFNPGKVLNKKINKDIIIFKFQFKGTWYEQQYYSSDNEGTAKCVSATFFTNTVTNQSRVIFNNHYSW